MDAFTGEIRLFAGTFAPEGWAACGGQLVQISQYQALYALLGTQYGGNGITDFALPDLRGRVPIHQGQSQGLSSRHMGQMGGQEIVYLTSQTMPQHSHALEATSDLADKPSPGDDVLGKSQTRKFYSSNPTNVDMGSNSVGSAGQGVPHENMQPSLTLQYIICLDNIFPSRN